MLIWERDLFVQTIVVRRKKKKFLKTVIIFTITFGDSSAPEIINFTFKDKGFQIKLFFPFMFLWK